MRIVNAAYRHHRVPIPHKVKTAFGEMDERHAVFLILEDEEGHQGIGESWVNFPPWAAWERAAMFEKVLIPWLNGRQVDDISAVVSEIYLALLGPAQQSGTVGPLLQAICAVELALWDLGAQSKAIPLAQLLFEAPNDRVRIYASGINSPIPWEFIDEHMARGVTLFKLKLGFGNEEDRRNLRDLRKHLGNRADIAVDVNRAWNLEEALKWLNILKDYNVTWLEEPLRIEEENRLEALRDRSPIPIAGGENVLMPPGCSLNCIAETSLDILQPDLTKYSPLHVALELLDVSKAKGKRVIPHFLGSAPGQAASLHFAAGCEDGMVEWDLNQNALRTALFKEPFQIQDGVIEIPNRPGLGWYLKDGIDE